MTMAGFAVIELVTPPVIFDVDVVLRIGAAAIALALIPLGLSPLTTILVLASILVAQVAYELARHGGHTHEASV
jgi:NADH:ubiquinone oxidoreductase subunit 3 (subunit A)